MASESPPPTGPKDSSSPAKPPQGGPAGRGPTEPKDRDGKRPLPRSSWYLLILMLTVGVLAVGSFASAPSEISFTMFEEQLEQKNVKRLIVSGQTAIGEFITPPLAPTASDDQAADADSATPAEPVRLNDRFLVTLPTPFLEEGLRKQVTDSGAEWKIEQPFDYDSLLALMWLGLLIFMGVMLWNFARRTREQMMGGGMLGSVTRSPARRYDSEDEGRKTFDDVAGLKGVKSDLKEIVEFLSDPEKFHKLGARVPKGVLLNGPPGTGKTLLAKAIAGEAGVPFFSISGSEFIQLFVGVGASRVRDMFKTAKKAAPAILFIDEIDAIGRQRGAGLGGGHDEREQTLNQILSEMDGFTQSETVIVIAATNRPDVLDPALLRPGRFDRHITVDRPTIEGREQLFEVHSKDVPIGEDVDFKRLARATVGSTGADIMNLVNEAALWATRQERKVVTMEDFEYARDKMLMGDRREDVLTEREKRVTAFHEAGHALLCWLLPSGNLLHKVTIIPRGRALGVTQYVPEEDRHNMSEREMHARLAMALAGRAAEQLVIGELSAGAESDLKQATQIARRMVTHWGMSERIGPVAFHTHDSDPFLGREITQEHRDFSEHTLQVIDEETTRILREAADVARTTIEQNRDKLDKMAAALLEREEIDETEMTELIGPAAKLPEVPAPDGYSEATNGAPASTARESE
ncbi:ATP-dependent zinc metalloprotease FtsH [Pseudobythopirellula maris]|uniref:ATP-dependent zinc metalloprotease FtsH n=1 Tax=Pseudobythopirellula maris TaxID=2527991 RepID=A0A5C5ZMW6_9BACT|nr:ATP-dependent zinc metalloprotease FtsH [Pseudobythopirellula maris]TWT88510.1 ATP-dependent zinc metalloprotease FtsH [Pseudobythopirellula maris]